MEKKPAMLPPGVLAGCPGGIRESNTWREQAAVWHNPEEVEADFLKSWLQKLLPREMLIERPAVFRG